MSKQGVADIKIISEETGRLYSPPIWQDNVVSDSWTELEYRCFTDPTGRFFGGLWTGEPGEMRFTPTGYDELCVITEGRILLTDTTGTSVEFGVGDAFMIPRDFHGSWKTLESTKVIMGVFE